MSNIKEQIIKKLKNGLNTKLIGQDIKYYSTLSSTNEEARRLADLGAIEGTVVLAETQTGGRGRRGRAWESPAGGIWFTILLRPRITPALAPLITLISGISGVNTISKIANLNSTLKWPNDIRINGKKVCGILTELTTEQDMVSYILVGLGFNVNNKVSDFPIELSDKATTLSEELNHELDRNLFTRDFFEEFENLYFNFVQNPDKYLSEILEEWRKVSDTLGRNVKIETISGVINGIAIDISPEGALILKKETGEELKIIAGDCIYLDQ
jgi:BirA family biotin operon repressor/biotin-[acetyl-CoA-carboxylase] ligase